MAAPHLFAHCSEALCVAEDTAVSFFSQKALKKFRVERFSGARICGLYIQRTLDGAQLLHVVDAEANWFVVALHNIAMVSSNTIRMESEETKLGKPIIGGRPRRCVDATTADEASTSNPHADGMITAAHFHQAEGGLHCVLLTPSAVYELPLRQSGDLRAKEIMRFTQPMRETVLALGDRTGLVAVGQVGQRWMQCSRFHARDTDKSLPLRRTLIIALQSLSCGPLSDAIAVGGARGELAVYPALGTDHHFSDHWHHTALTALSFSVDGTALYTGAQESVLLVWNLSSYTHKKIRCALGPIRCVVPSHSAGSTLLLACATSTLASVDLLQMRLQHAVEGVEWSAGASCTGLVVMERWMGQPAVILTGLPNVLRVCDPLTQQALYSLHISSQMETLPTPPKHGIVFAGVLRGGRVLVTYESFAATPSLPPLLRFWVYDAAHKRHVETQTVFSPHTSEVRALQVDAATDRVFTMCRDAIKSWEEVRADVADALSSGDKRSWRNQSTSPTPSQQVSSMILSEDGSLCLVTDDCVHVYGVAQCRPGERWPLLQTLTQDVSVQPLHDVVLLSAVRTVAARDNERVYLWDLGTAELTGTYVSTTVSDDADGGVTALCDFTESTLLLADGPRTLVELDTTGRVVERVEHGNNSSSSSTGHCLRFMQRLPLGADSRRVAVVDDATGFRVLHVPAKAKRADVQRLEGSTRAAAAAAGEDTTEEISLQRYFGERPAPAVGSSGAATEEQQWQGVEGAARTARANRWLTDVLHEAAYTVPPMSSVLSLYLRRRTTGAATTA